MSVSLYFGLPGSGKSTLVTFHALKVQKNKKIKNVYCNVDISVPGVTLIDNSCIGKYQLEDGVLLIDEASLFADSRDYKNFTKELIEFFLKHRHSNLDIRLYTQQWDAIDKKIRVITDRVYYVFKDRLLGHWFTSYYRIPYGIIIPDGNKKGSGEKLGDIVQGYCKPSFIIRLFSHKIYRPKYYKYFDSWERKILPPLPKKYKTVPRQLSPYQKIKWIFVFIFPYEI